MRLHQFQNLQTQTHLAPRNRNSGKLIVIGDLRNKIANVSAAVRTVWGFSTDHRFSFLCTYASPLMAMMLPTILTAMVPLYRISNCEFTINRPRYLVMILKSQIIMGFVFAVRQPTI